MLNLQSVNTFTRTVPLSVPGEAVDTTKQVSFKATFKLLGQDEWEKLTEDASKSDALRAVLVKVEGVEPGKDDDGTVLTPEEIVCRHELACDAAFAAYVLYLGNNSRGQMQSAAQAKNSKRSRGR